VRDTSVKAYTHITTTGILGERRTQVYDVLYHNGPIGSREVWEEIKKIHTKKPIPQHSINPRFKELKRMGVVREIGEHTCPYTNRTVITWDVTSKLPNQKYKAELSKADQLRAWLNLLDDASGDKKIVVRRVTKRIRKAMEQIGL